MSWICQKNYGLHINNETHYFDIEIGIKDAATEDELMAYYLKNGKKVISEFISNHNKTVEEYKQVIEETKDLAWQIAYYEEQKNYWETCVSHGAENDNYKEAVKILKKLKSKK